MEPPKNWFITGAPSGFGWAFAEHAIKRGHNVVVTARTIARLQPLVDLAPEHVLAVELNVDRAGDADATVAAALSRFSRIDVLMNNVGYGVVGAFEETSEAELRAIMETNFFGAAAVIRAVLPALRTQGSGAIVNISRLGGQLSFPGFSAYSASKFALEGVSEALAAELKPLGIKVLIVEPGNFRTNLAGANMRHMPELDAYRGSVGGTRQFAHDMHGTQEGDPAKAAAAIEAALNADNTPLRLQLGADAVDAVRAHALTLLADLDAWETLARGTGLSAPSE